MSPCIPVQRKPLQRSFHVIVKPIGSLCNLDCTYCYYLHKKELLQETAGSIISDDLLEEFIRTYIAAQDTEFVNFTWHGGEPTLLGLDFYRKVLRLQQQYAGTKRINNALQTNGLLLDEAWCGFLREHRFLVGLSIDGPKHLHDLFRASKGGEPSFDRVYRAARLLQEYDIAFNTVTVINAVNARHPDEVYGFLAEDLGSRHIQWIPCVEPKDFCTVAPGRWDVARMPILGTPAAKPGNPASVVTDWSVDPDDWGEFLCRTFDLWLQNGIGTVLVNWFESLIGQWMRQPPQMCSLAEVCGRSLIVMDKDGSLYPCEHFVFPEYRLGNLHDQDCQLAGLAYSPGQRKFGCIKRDRLPEYCKQCAYRFACNGECPKNRFIKTPDGQPGLNYLCPGLKRFLAHADPFLRQIVAQIHRSVPP
jgi:uncharacterized protein